MGVKVISVQEAKKIMDVKGALLIDVREPAEYHSMHIQGSELMPLTSFDGSKVPKDQKVILHCQRGRRSEIAIARIEGFELMDIYSMTGGIEAWRSQGYPVQQAVSQMISIDRQTQIVIGFFVSAFCMMAINVHINYLYGALFFGLGLLSAGLTGWCGLGKLMAKMPWN